MQLWKEKHAPPRRSLAEKMGSRQQSYNVYIKEAGAKRGGC